VTAPITSPQTSIGKPPGTLVESPMRTAIDSAFLQRVAGRQSLRRRGLCYTRDAFGLRFKNFSRSARVFPLVALPDVNRKRNMMRREKFAIANIYVPVKRRATLKPETVRQIAESMLEVGQQVPIQVRRDGDRFVLVEGLHRLEACKALGEETIYGYLTQAPKH
jgi:sulfiredoxin